MSHISSDRTERQPDVRLRVRRRMTPDIDGGPSERNNSPGLSKYRSMCQGFARRFLCPIFRDPLRGERIAIRPPRRRTRLRIDPSRRGKSDSPRDDTAKVLNIQRAGEMRRESEGRRERWREEGFVFGCYPMDPTTFGVVVDLENCLSSFKARGDSLRLIITCPKMD